MAKRKPQPAYRIPPGEMWNREECRQNGVGDILLVQARKSGLVKPAEIGNSLWYSTDDLIAWMKSKRLAKREVGEVDERDARRRT